MSRSGGKSANTRKQGGGGQGPKRARAIAAQRLAQQRAAERRRRALLGGLIAAVVLIGAVIIGVAVYNTQNKTPSSFAVPSGGSRTGITVGKSNAKATVDLYIDYMCPRCKEFEKEAGSTIDQLVANGSAKVVYHPLAFLDNASTTNYSTRASAAAACAADAGAFPAFSKALFDNQPAEGSAGLSDDALIQLGEKAGAPPSFGSCVKSGKYKDWTASLTDAASKNNVTVTPTVLVNGKVIQTPTAQALRTAVEQAAAK